MVNLLFTFLFVNTLCISFPLGNFSFFWVRRDFSLYRVLKMLFRLNFLVVITCLVVRNEYMLYYICPMHTFWFLSVYCFMKLLNTWNEDPKKMTVKFMIYFLAVMWTKFIIWHARHHHQGISQIP